MIFLDLEPEVKVTTKLPLPGFAALMLTLYPAALRTFSTLAALDLNAFQDLQASILACKSLEEALTVLAAKGLEVLATAAFFTVVFFALPIVVSGSKLSLMPKIDLCMH